MVKKKRTKSSKRQKKPFIYSFPARRRAAGKKYRGDNFTATTHKRRSEWFRDNVSWPAREGLSLKVASQRRRIHRTLPSASLAANWQMAGPENIGGRMTSIVCHPHDADIIWAGAAGGGVWHSPDAGLTWTAQWHKQESLNVGSLAIDPNNPDVLYCGTGEANLSADSYPGVGIYRSENGGASWRLITRAAPNGIPSRIGCIAVDPFDSQHLFIAGVGHYLPNQPRNGGLGGLYESPDGGNTWFRLEFISPFNHWCHDVVFHPSQPNIIFATFTDPGSENGIWRSLDGGATWEHLTAGLPDSDLFGRTRLAISPTAPHIIYAIASSESSGVLGVFKSINDGEFWQGIHGNDFNYSRPIRGGAFSDNLERQMSYNITIAVHPNDPDHVICGGVDLHLTTDGGTTWTNPTKWDKDRGDSDYAHADHHALMMPAANPGRVYVMNDGGMDVSEDGGNTWVNRSNGLSTTMFYDFDVAQGNQNFKGGGAQDNGTPISTTGSTNDFFDFTDGDGGWIVFDPTNEAHLFVSSQRLRIVRHRPPEGWRDASPNTSNLDRIPWMAFLVMDPSNSQRLFTGTNRVWRSEDDGDSWRQISPFFRDIISALEVAQANPQIVYAGTNSGNIHKSMDGGENWSGDISSSLIPGFRVTRLKTYPDNPLRVVATIGNFDNSHVFLSEDGGTTWNDIDNGQLPDVPHNSIVIPTGFPDELYVANDIGVFVSTNAGNTWQNLTGNLPNVSVTDIVYHENSGTLYAATYGRSAWQIKIH